MQKVSKNDKMSNATHQSFWWMINRFKRNRHAKFQDQKNISPCCVLFLKFWNSISKIERKLRPSAKVRQHTKSGSTGIPKIEKFIPSLRRHKKSNRNRDKSHEKFLCQKSAHNFVVQKCTIDFPISKTFLSHSFFLKALVRL